MTLITNVPCHSSLITLKNTPCSVTIGAEHSSICSLFTALCEASISTGREAIINYPVNKRNDAILDRLTIFSLQHFNDLKSGLKRDNYYIIVIILLQNVESFA